MTDHTSDPRANLAGDSTTPGDLPTAPPEWVKNAPTAAPDRPGRFRPARAGARIGIGVATALLLIGAGTGLGWMSSALSSTPAGGTAVPASQLGSYDDDDDAVGSDETDDTEHDGDDVEITGADSDASDPLLLPASEDAES